MLGVSEPILVGMAILVIVGHNFPVWLGFRGGKGIATSAGVILGLFPWMVFVASILAWVALFFSTRFVSLGSIAASLMLTVSMSVLWFLGMTSTLLLGVASLMTLLALLRHRSNISRLFAGTEPRFQRRAREQNATPVATPAVDP
jgi:glycerol-3-phosphate acyltransferase PlsY